MHDLASYDVYHLGEQKKQWKESSKGEFCSLDKT